MSYNPTTDFLALLRLTGGGVRSGRTPGLDYVVEALARAGLIALSVGPTAPVASQATTVWFQPALPSWSNEGAVFLWNATAGVYQPATPILWSAFIAGPFVPAPGNDAPLVDGIASAGVSPLYSREDHAHPIDTTRAPLASPALTGAPTAPTQTLGDSSNKLATTQFVIANGGLPPPIGSVLPYAGLTAPNANWQICVGQAVSRTTFATLFGIVGVTYGSGDGVTTFNLPDLRGRVVAGADGGVNRLTNATMSTNAAGGIGGTETVTLTLAQLPTITSGNATQTINVSTSGITAVLQSPTSANAGTTGSALQTWTGGSVAAAGSTGVNSVSVTSNATFGNAHLNVQPTMELGGMIIRVS